MSADPIGILGKIVSEKYRIERFVAEGGFSVVYRALHVIWNRPVAIKFFSALSLTAGHQRQELERAFINEGALLTELSSQTTAIVQARDVGSITMANKQWLPYLVLEWVDGAALDLILEDEQARRDAPWSLEQVQRFLGRIARAVAIVHRHGVAHRDLKPGNILVVGGNPRHDDVSVKILDFGVAKLMLDHAGFQAALTATGRTFTAFTPHYGAPEQFSQRFGATGPWTDVYALALIAVEMLCGRPALDGRDVAELSAQSTDATRRPTPRIFGVSVPNALEQVLQKALALKPQDRYTDAGHFWTAFESASGLQKPDSVPPSAPPAAVESSAPPPSKPASRLGGVLGVALLAAVCVTGGVLWGLRDAKRNAQFIAAAPASISQGAAAIPMEAAAPSCPKGMLYVEAGLFFAGTDRTGTPKNQRPAHQIRLRAFCIHEHEVTLADFEACTNAGHCREAPLEVHWPGIIGRDRLIFGNVCNARYADRRDHPMNCVSWDTAQGYCAAHHFRLPTEAEWEYVARGPKIQRFTWGEDAPSAKLLNACGTECLKWSHKNDAGYRLLYHTSDRYPNTAPVGAFPDGRSRFGAADMEGNVREWTADWYGAYSAEPVTDPTGPAQGDRRVVRGSSWTTGDARELGHMQRSTEPPEARRHDLGFRCASGPAR
ncbi:MAG TPA: SUMF1/EgtB/PvdO family nonheme iron enzyme [Polyangiaceae bacterium]|nr:SUMF1/EgtB/PvdO family nonheme iron enzyme [Polyangiaceae bacterium]